MLDMKTKLILLVLTSSLLSSCAIRTPDEELAYMRQTIRVPIAQDVYARAKQADEQFLSTKTIHGQNVTFVNDERNERLRRILDKISEGNASKFTVRVVDSDPKIENAFVTGVFYIYVYTGLIDAAKSDDELAFVLGHELAHVRLRHAQRHDNSYAELASAITKLAAATQKDAIKRDNWMTASDTVSSFYSRDHEREADAQAVIWAQKAGYKPTDSFNFFRRMIRAEQEYKTQIEVEKNRRINKVTELNQGCQNQIQQLQLNASLRTPQNQQVVQNNCNNAYAFALQTQEFMKNVQRDELKSLFTRTHPTDQERIGYIGTLTNYVNCRASEQQLADTGRGYYVFKAVNFTRTC
jgi:predicted Zn-dependent protease